MKFKTSLLSLSIMASSALLTACGGDDNDSDQSYDYKVEVTNLTYSQPLSPVAIVIHNKGYEMFSEAESASLALEELAESGATESLLYEAQAHESVILTLAGENVILPGKTAQFSLSLERDIANQQISLASMLVNTNDAFTGINHSIVNPLSVDEVQTFYGPVWDAGTEQNSETAATIPGPAGNGEGFNVERDNDIDKVVFHGGVVSHDDGLESSVLTEQHRFNQPASLIRITRVQ